jgi:CBS domain containing-hemolysin-like protein
MTESALWWTAGLGTALACLGATGSKVLQDIPRHAVEAYARRRQSTLDRAILSEHNEAALGAECLQILGTIVAVAATTAWFVDLQPGLITKGPFLWYSVAMAIGFLAVILWIPWAINQLFAAPFVFHTWPLWWTAQRVTWPLTIGVTVVGEFLRRLAGRPEAEEPDDEELFEDEIRSVVTAGLRDGVLEAAAGEMIEGVIELGDGDVGDVMTPRSRVDALDVNTSFDEMVQFVITAGRTRVPVYDSTLNRIQGVLYAKDLLAEFAKADPAKRATITDLVRKPWYIPSTKSLDEMLRDFLSTRKHLAIVVDEYESMVGVVTIEDVLEEIVGEIVDEYDHEEDEEGLVRLDDSTLETSGNARIDDLNEHLGLTLPEGDDFDTIGGLLMRRLGRIPEAGESVAHDGVVVTVLEANARQIKRVQLKWDGAA